MHSQTVQMIFHAFLANIETTRQVKKQNPKMCYPYKDKRFYPLLWPKQAVWVRPGRVVLPMGRGRGSIVLKADLLANAGACKIVWNDGYELHVCVLIQPADASPGTAQATVGLGQIHQAAVTVNTGEALVVFGRGIRSVKRRLNQALGEIAKKRARCWEGSRRWRKLQRARTRVSARCAICATRAPGRGWSFANSRESEASTSATAKPWPASQPAHLPVGIWSGHRLPGIQM